MIGKKEKFTLNDLLCIYYFLLPVLQLTFFPLVPFGGYLSLIGLSGLIVLVISKEPNCLVRYADILILYGVLAALLVVAFILHPERRVWIMRDYGVKTILLQGGIFAYPTIRLQKTPEQFFRNLKISIIIRGVYYAYMALEPLRNGYWLIEQFGSVQHFASNMTWSYGVLMVVSVLSVMALQEKKKILFVPVGIGLLGILLYGSRGSIVCYAIGAVLFILFGERKKLKLKKVVIILVAVVFVAFIFSDFGANTVALLAQRTGIKSRFITTYLNMMQGNKSLDSESSGRDRIWKLVLSMIRERPLGYGMMGHRNAIYRIGIKWGYSHNLFLDWLAEYGVFFGSLLIIGLIFMNVRMIRNNPLSLERLLMILFITLSCEMLFSAYYWIHFGIWSILALYVNHFKGRWHEVRKGTDMERIVQVLIAEEIV
ncbi:MAG: O-antigen ligase family protein [Oscillospiraceae bacterium]|nr:O-antigen ligase family protein [Oscillospiraceae bacterium]